MGTRHPLLRAALAALAPAAIWPAAAAATDFAGSSAGPATESEPGALTLTISDARVTGLQARFVGTCRDGAYFTGQLALQGGPVRIASDGRVRVPVTGRHERGYPITGTVTLSGASDDAQVVRGDLTASLAGPDGPCTMQRAVLAAPRVTDRPSPRPGFRTAGGPPVVSFDVVGRALRAVYVSGPSGCPASGSFAWSGDARGLQQVRLAKNGVFSTEGWALTEGGDVVHVRLTGTVVGDRALGSVRVDVPARTGCAGAGSGWTAQARDHTGAPRPEVSMQVNPYQHTVDGGGPPDFGLAVTGVSCVRATHFRVAVAGRAAVFPCTVSRRPFTVVARGLRGDHSYGVRVTALRIAGGRVRSRGGSFTDIIRIPPASDPAWTPVS